MWGNFFYVVDNLFMFGWCVCGCADPLIAGATIIRGHAILLNDFFGVLCHFIFSPVEQLCRGDEDTSLERVGALLIESFEEVFGVDTMPMDDFP